MRIRWGPGPDDPSNSLSHWFQTSMVLPFASSEYRQFCQTRRSTAFSTLKPMDPANPEKPCGTGSGILNSPRCATRMRLGVSANTPELPPNAKPAFANGLCQNLTTSYGLGPTGPETTASVVCATITVLNVNAPADSASPNLTTCFTGSPSGLAAFILTAQGWRLCHGVEYQSCASR